MDVAVVYESLFGNTRDIAEAIAAGIRQANPAARVTVLRVAEAGPGQVAEAGFLVVGGPTHIMRMSSERTRQMGLQGNGKSGKDQRRRTEPEPGAAGPGVREWLAALPMARPGAGAAAFDTRLRYPLAGGAARPIARQLRRHGYRVTAKATGFLVDDAEGPLHEGERERARAWGATLAAQLAAPTHR